MQSSKKDRLDRASPDRRTVLASAATVGSVIVAGLLGIPTALAVFTPALRRSRQRWRVVGPVRRFQSGSVQLAVVPINRGDWAHSLDQKSVYVWKQSDGQFVVYSRNCTDLGCPVNFDRGSECFLCPCHGGIFNLEGRPLAGPPKDPLYRYAVRVRGEQLEIDLASLPPMT